MENFNREIKFLKENKSIFSKLKMPYHNNVLSGLSNMLVIAEERISKPEISQARAHKGKYIYTKQIFKALLPKGNSKL